MSRTRKAKHRARCRLCHPGKHDGNSAKHANAADRRSRQADDDARQAGVS